MWKAALAGVVALATTGATLTTTTVRADESRYHQQPVQVGIMLSDAQITRYKAALRLNAEQERYWPAVAAALRSMRVGNRMAALAANSLGLRQLMSAARPLYDRLDDGQRQVAMRLVQSLGFGSFAAAL
jgi:hypothetical protein